MEERYYEIFEVKEWSKIVTNTQSFEKINARGQGTSEQSHNCITSLKVEIWHIRHAIIELLRNKLKF